MLLEAGFERQLPVFLLTVAGQGDQAGRRHRRLPAQGARHGIAIHAGQADVAEHYVRTFDLPGKKHNRCAPYLTYFRHGDTRRRGMAMIEFKGAYRGAGFTPCEDELPDYVPMVLDFAAFSPRGVRLLREHRADLELLQRALQEAGSPYADLLVAVGAQLPRLGRRELVQVVKAWESGPPREDVGLEPFAPPEYLSGYGAAPTAGGV